MQLTVKESGTPRQATLALAGCKQRNYLNSHTGFGLNANQWLTILESCNLVSKTPILTNDIEDERGGHYGPSALLGQPQLPNDDTWNPSAYMYTYDSSDCSGGTAICKTVFVVSGPAHYIYGFDNMRKDNEVTGNDGDDYTADFWEYDARLGRRWNLDPVVDAETSPYACFANNPIWYSDITGAEPDNGGDILGQAQELEQQQIKNSGAVISLGVGPPGGDFPDNDGVKGPLMQLVIVTPHKNTNTPESVIEAAGVAKDAAEAYAKGFGNATIADNLVIPFLSDLYLGNPLHEYQDPLLQTAYAKGQMAAHAAVMSAGAVLYVNGLATAGASAAGGAVTSETGVGALVGGTVAVGALAVAEGGAIAMANAITNSATTQAEMDEINNNGGGSDGGEITIPDENKIPRDKLNPPNKSGNAPIFKNDGTSVEIHHEGQNPDGPYKEMHQSEHKLQDHSLKPSRINRAAWRKMRRAYWKKEYPNEKQ